MTPGVILIDKPAGITSAKAINPLKKLSGVKRIGHSGTLDPAATGLLVCVVNGATRLAAYAEQGEKTYSGTFLLGLVTTTDDTSGETIESCDVLPDFSEVEKVAREFLGEIEQIPPQYSAIKVDGRRAYQHAREGREIKLKARKVRVEEFKISVGESAAEINFVVRCSKGTYIRSLARDLGERLGCGGCLKSLRRESVGPYNVVEAKSPEQLTNDDILNWETLFPEVPVVELESTIAQKIYSGDQQALMVAGPALEQSGENKVVYRDRERGTSLGLLLKNGPTWKVGVNLK